MKRHKILLSAFVMLFALLIFSAVSAQTPVNVTIFSEEDSLTIYVPGNQTVSLEGFTFEGRC